MVDRVHGPAPLTEEGVMSDTLTARAIAETRFEAGRFITDEERAALRRNSMWGSDGYPIGKCGHLWRVDSPLAAGLPLLRTKREAITYWETAIDVLVNLSGLEAQVRAIAARDIARDLASTARDR